MVDYGVRQNPLLEQAQFKEEKTIEEMQATVFDIKHFEYFTSTDKMYYIPDRTESKSVQPILVEGEDFEGLGLNKTQVTEHIRELRALVYQILNSLIVGNAKICYLLVHTLAPKLS